MSAAASIASAADTLELLRGRAGPLVSEAFHRHASVLLAPFGASVTSLYLEVHLGEGPARTDLLVSFDARAGSLTEPAPPPEALGTEVVSRWRETAARSGDYPAVWLEYDGVDANVPQAFNPSVCVLPGYPAVPADWVDPGSTSDRVMRGLRLLDGEPCSASDAALLAEMTGSLPGYIIHVSRMLARVPAALKLYAVIDRRSFVPFLRQNGFRGDAIEGVLTRYCPKSRVGDCLYVDLTVTGFHIEGGSRVGLSFSPQHLIHSGETDPSRGALLAQLVADGLCTEEQSRWLSNWPGTEPRHPADGRGGFVLVDRWLDVKVVWAKGALAAKAYLGARARRLF